MQYNPTIHKLSNDVAVILDSMDAATAAVSVCFKTGSRNEKPSEYGITHFCEHMLCKGTHRFPDAQSINDYVSDNAGTRGARTSDDKMELHGVILSDNTELLLDVFADQLQNSVFDAAKIERERTIIADELRRGLDDESRGEAEFIIQQIFAGDFTVYRTLGTFENIASFSRKQMQMFMARRFSGKNCLVCVSGKIDNPEKLLGAIEQKFAFLPAMDVPENDAAPSYGPAVAHMSQGHKHNVDISVLTPNLYPQKTSQNRYRRMCVNRMDQYLNQELFRVLRTENGLVYGVDVEDFSIDGIGIKGFFAKTAPENVARMVELMARTTHNAFATKTITDEFLNRYNNRCRLGDAMFLESPMRRRDRLVKEWLDYGTLYDFNELVRLANSITPQDVIAHSRGLFEQPISIISTGADYDADVMKIWRQNHDGHQDVMHNMIQAKGEKCH